MSKENNLKDFLTDVADAIREKKGTTDLISPLDFSDEIKGIKSEPTKVPVKDVVFIDHEGTVLYSYTKDEFLQLEAMPKLPTKKGLICQGWNYEYDEAIDYVSNYGMLHIGATYITDDGKTRLYIRIETDGRMNVPLYFNQTVANGVSIDWGDGSALQTLNGTGNVNTSHLYESVGDYCITLEVLDECKMELGRDSSYGVLGSTSNSNAVYTNMLKRVEIGDKVTRIRFGTFLNCYSLISATIPQGVTSMNNDAFQECSSLYSIVIPKGATSVSSFSRANSLLYISMPSSLTAFNDFMFVQCSSLKAVSIPSGVTNTRQSTFYECYSLARVSIPDSVVYAYDYTFYKCYSLASIIVPSSVKYIYASSFFSCAGLAYIDFSKHTSVPYLEDSNVSYGLSSDCKIIVSDAMYEQWIAATNWSALSSKIIKKSDWDASH